MRVTMLTLAVLTLGACGGDQAQENQAAVEDNLNVVSTTGEDITAIDAATGHDANMAADAEVLLNDGGNEAANGASEDEADNAG